MSPQSRGRKRRRNPAQTQRRRGTTSGQIDGDPTAEFLAALAEALEDAVDGADPLGAEMLGSGVVGQIVQGVHGGPDEVAEAFAELVRTCERVATPQALVVAALLAQMAPAEGARALAAEVAESLANRVRSPSWLPALGRARLQGCWEVRDVFGDQASVLCEFSRGPLFGALPRHGLMFLVDFNGPGTWLKDVFVLDDLERALRDMRAQARDSSGVAVFEALALDEAHSLLEGALGASLTRSHLDAADEDVSDLGALAASRLRTIRGTARPSVPSPWPSEALGDLVAEFCRSPQANEVSGMSEAAVRACATRIARYGNEEDAGQPLRVGPGKTAALVALHGIGDDVDDDVRVSGAVLRAWNEWAAAKAGLSPSATRVLLEETDAIVAMMSGLARGFAGPADRDNGRGGRQLAGDESGGPRGAGRDRRGQGAPPSRAHPTAADDAVARRAFAAPTRTATIGGEVITGLDPEDENDLELLVIGEHPQYHAALEAGSDDLVDEVNPRLHIALHAVVATRLWHDHPRSTWREAQRLLAQGMERHAVLHELMSDVADEVHGALSVDIGLMGAMADSRPRTVREQRSGPSDAGRRLPRSSGSGSSASAPSYRVRVDLLAARPPIWRRLLLPGAVTLQDLHLVLQIAFDWTDDHLHVFTVGRRRYGDPALVDEVVHEASVHLQDVVAEAGDAIEDEYDFGDSWRHRLVVEEVVRSPPPGVRCLGGRRAGPAEDSGGIWRWNELVEASRDPDHPARDDAAAMLRSDPASFDVQSLDARHRLIPSA